MINHIARTRARSLASRWTGILTSKLPPRSRRSFDASRSGPCASGATSTPRRRSRRQQESQADEEEKERAEHRYSNCAGNAGEISPRKSEGPEGASPAQTSNRNSARLDESPHLQLKAHRQADCQQRKPQPAGGIFRPSEPFYVQCAS